MFQAYDLFLGVEYGYLVLAVDCSFMKHRKMKSVGETYG
ncbi:hypothetical protein B835_275 [Enterococcus mundtii 3F]|nr:hypothetical protein [Enterococcus mundtii 3F]